MQYGSENLPAGVKKFTGLYRFISPGHYRQWGIDPEDVPMGAIAAENHPPFLPDRFGGNAYGLGIFEQNLLSPDEVDLIESLDMTEPGHVSKHYRPLNDIFKSLGLLVRYTDKGLPYYLIPRQFVAHFLVEIQAITDEIEDFVKDLLSRKLRETLRTGVIVNDAELLMPELQARMPHIEFLLTQNLEQIVGEKGQCDAVIVVGDPRDVFLENLSRQSLQVPDDREKREAFGHFCAGLIYDMLDPEGEVLCLCDAPLSSTREIIDVRFKDKEDLKRFLLFCHVYRTRRHYSGVDGLSQSINKFDFEAFIVGLGLYHETMESLLGGKPLKDVRISDIDRLPYQDLPLPRGSVERVMASWRRWFGTYFHLERLDTALPEVQRVEWESHYEVEGDLPDTLIAMQGRRRLPLLTLESLEGRGAVWRHLAGCRRELLADYKDSFAYVNDVLEFLERVRHGQVERLPGLELSRLRKPFENIGKHTQFKDVLRLVEMAPRLCRMEQRLNTDDILGPHTPVLENLGKLSLMGLEEGLLDQLYLIVLGHSTMSRVTFGKLPEGSLRPLTDLSRFKDLDEAIDILRLYRLLSVAESVAANKNGLSSQQVAELFNLYDQAVRVVTDPELDWDMVLDAQISRAGGVQSKATRKMLKIFNLFEYLEDWQQLEKAGPRLKEVMADFNPGKLERIDSVVQLLDQVSLFVGKHYAADSTARPYFFRALLNSELHGTGRLLPRLGTAAGFTLLWICVGISQRRLLNFNPLLKSSDKKTLDNRLDKIRQALLGLDVRDLSPQHLNRLMEEMAEKGEAYIGNSGLYVRMDRESGALIPLFVDAAEEIEALEQMLKESGPRPLSELSDQTLVELETRADATARFLAAQQHETKFIAALSRRFEMTQRRLEDYCLEQLFNLEQFADNFTRLSRFCPNLISRLLPTRGEDPMGAGRLRAAQKLSAVYHHQLSDFQDMELSHELARQEFGPATAGVVGVSWTQFQTLSATLNQIIEKRPDFSGLLMLSVLMFRQAQLGVQWYSRKLRDLAGRVKLDSLAFEDLLFLLENLDVPRQVIMGEACLSALQPVLERDDPLLVEALFMLSQIRTASIREGLLTEDLVYSFTKLREQVRGLGQRSKTAKQAHMDQIEDFAKQLVAFDYYREVQDQVAPTASLRQLLETSKVPYEDRKKWMKRGRRLAGLDRLLKLRGLQLIDALDLQMLRHQIPVAYIYRLKGLRSLGPTHFERDLYEGLRLYRGLRSLPQQIGDALLGGIADPERPMRLVGFRWAAERLTYTNQIRLLLLGLAAGRRLQQSSPGPVTVSFIPLARVMARRFEMVNEVFSAMDPAAFGGANIDLDAGLEQAGIIRLELDLMSRVANLHLSEAAGIERMVEALRLARDAETLKQMYHDELRTLRLTSHGHLDYAQRLEDAFEDSLSRLGQDMLENVRKQMAAETELENLVRIYGTAKEKGLELPLSRDRQQSLRDLFEYNVERLRSKMLDDVASRLRDIGTLAELDEYWGEIKKQLKGRRRWLGKDFFSLIAHRFDIRARALK